MEELEEERKEIFEYLTGILPLVSNRDELETHFNNIPKSCNQVTNKHENGNIVK